MSSSYSSVDFAQPNPKNRLYDVFLSFRGKDTRYGFTFNLFESLKGNNIHTFMDVNNTGHDIKHLFAMASISKVAIVIFSENFASSKWCLKELELILQRRKENKMLMIPIFYNINVHELQHLTGKTVEYLDKHILKHGETTVQKWKDAVTSFGQVSGLSNKLRYEFDFIAEVVAKTKQKIKECEEILERAIKPYNSGLATEHDVFISLMGKDTLYGVVSHLYKALTEKDIKTFFDDQDHSKDETIIFELIQRSKMAVIVFSENYASSKWCLRELVKILQCRNDRKMQVVLILFEISPSELKNQAAEDSRISYLLEEHNELSDTVKSWRDAITDRPPYNCKSELDNFIQGLVEEISAKLNRVDEKKESTINQQAHVSSAKEEITQALALQTDTCSPRSGEECRVRSEEAQDNLTEHVADSSSTQSSSTADTRNTTTGDEQQVYRVFTSTNFQKSREYTGKLLSVKPDRLYFYVEPEKQSSTRLILSNNTDSYVAFMIQCTTEPLKYRVCPSEGLMLPRSTCQVIVTMEVQRTMLPTHEGKWSDDKFYVQSVIAKNDSYNSTNVFSYLFKKKWRNCIDNWWMKVYCIAPPQQLSSISDHRSQLVNKGFILGSIGVPSLDIHPTKPWLLLGFIYGSVCIWNYETRAEEKSFKVVDTSDIVYAKFIYEKHWFVVGDRNGFVRVFDYNTSEKAKEFKAHEDGIVCVAVHPTSPYVLTASRDKLVKLWNWENDWACIETFEGHSDIVMQVAFNPKDSKSFASASLDGTIKLWSFDSSVAKFTINPHGKGLNCVTYFVGHDNKLYLLSGCDNYSARVWDYESKTLVKTLEGHSSHVQTTHIHPNFPIIITGSTDKTIHIWNKNTHRLEVVWNCDLGKVWSIEFINTSNEVVLGCEDGMVVIKIVKAGT